MDQIDYRKLFYDALPNMISLLEIPSVYDASSANDQMPYGINVCKAFAYMKELAEKDGFKVSEYDGHALSISWGTGKERIDIASHLDVVVADEEGFHIRIEGNRLIGRGTVDMKVPMFLSYLALKLLRERYPEISKEIRIVLGGDEERTMNDMRYYLSRAGQPDFAFTPDGYFPMIISEKGAIMWTMDGDYEGRVLSLHGGSQCNVIPDHAVCELAGDDKYEDLKTYITDHRMDASVAIRNGSIILETRGKAAHASMPSLGHSAINDLLVILAHVIEDRTCRELYSAFYDSYGKGIDSYAGEKPNECLSLSIGILTIEKGKLSAQVDCRFPFGMKAEELTERLQDRIGLHIELQYNDPPTHCEQDDSYVAAMLKTYRRITGDNSECIVSGGVSYTKVFGHCVGFGPVFPGEIPVAHQKNEFIDLDRCVRILEIYYETIKELAFLEI